MEKPENMNKQKIEAILEKQETAPIETTLALVNSMLKNINPAMQTKLGLYRRVAGVYNIPEQALIDYQEKGENDSETITMSALLEGTNLSAAKINKLLYSKKVLAKCGNSWRITEEYKMLGTSKQNLAGEYYPRWYSNKKEEILKLINT